MEAKSPIINTIGMKFVLIPAGEFTMGAPIKGLKWKDPLYNLAKDAPEHRVVITNPFYMQTTEVTEEQWTAVMGANPSKHPGKDLPVESISWNDTQEFLSKLNAMENTDTYRLPTEAEWEYSCRAGSAGAYCFGNDELQVGEYTWYSDNSGDVKHPVGTKKPNIWGLYDMHGNVSEWCLDWYDKDFYSHSPIENPIGPDTGIQRVHRGGCYWGDFAIRCRSYIRHSFPPDSRNAWYIGFRVCRSIGP